MRYHPTNPASVYRVHSPREADEDFKRHIPGIARAFIADMIGGPPRWIRALTSSARLPRNYFTTAPEPEDLYDYDDPFGPYDLGKRGPT